jgi:hypothetical protein
VTVEIHIYKGRGNDWILEVVDAAKNSHVWDEQFQTDQQAFVEATPMATSNSSTRGRVKFPQARTVRSVSQSAESLMARRWAASLRR